MIPKVYSYGVMAGVGKLGAEVAGVAGGVPRQTVCMLGASKAPCLSFNVFIHYRATLTTPVTRHLWVVLLDEGLAPCCSCC